MYVSSGGGTGAWARVNSSNIQGMAGDGGVANLKTVSDGVGGFKFLADGQYGDMVITTNTNTFTMTAAVDPTLNTNSDYVLFTGTGAPWAAHLNTGVTFSTDRLTVSANGIYRVDFWGTISQFPSNTAKVAVKHRINGTTLVARHPTVKSNSAGDSGNLNGFGLVQLNAGDYLQLMVASTASGGLIIADANLTVSLVEGL